METYFVFNHNHVEQEGVIFMQIEQFVMAYGIEQDRIRAILPQGFQSLRPVLRINGEIRDGKEGYLEFNTAVEKDGVKGWLNIAFWDFVPFARDFSALPSQRRSKPFSGDNRNILFCIFH